MKKLFLAAGAFLRMLLNAILAVRGSKRRVDRVLISWDFVVRGRPAPRRALFLHRSAPLLWNDRDPRFLEHSIDWESTQLASGIESRGYALRAVAGWSPLIASYEPEEKFDLVLDENANLPLFQFYLNPGARKLLYLTGSYPRFQNTAQDARLKALLARRGRTCYPLRMLRADMYETALEMADAVLLVGNEATAATYPERFRSKLIRTTISASPTVHKTHDQMAPKEREFLWFFGQGAVHKGLDLVIEAFAGHPEWILNIAGPVAQERDFCEIYKKELSLPNIRLHGFMRASSPEFHEMILRCAAFLAPSCSEGISPAAATCMQAGLYPVVSRNTGVTLPDGAGTYLGDCAIQEIEAAVENVLAMPASQLADAALSCQKFAMDEYSRRSYVRDTESFFNRVLTHA